MSVRQVKDALRDVIEAHANVGLCELRRIFADVIRDIECDLEWPQDQQRKPWSDDELRIVLSDAPTKDNCLKHARGFGRGYGAIEQIYRWAATDRKAIEAKGRAEDSFIRQIKRVARQLGWRA